MKMGMDQIRWGSIGVNQVSVRVSWGAVSFSWCRPHWPGTGLEPQPTPPMQPMAIDSRHILSSYAKDAVLYLSLICRNLNWAFWGASGLEKRKKRSRLAQTQLEIGQDGLRIPKHPLFKLAACSYLQLHLMTLSFGKVPLKGF